MKAVKYFTIITIILSTYLYGENFNLKPQNSTFNRQANIMNLKSNNSLLLLKLTSKYLIKQNYATEESKNNSNSNKCNFIPYVSNYVLAGGGGFAFLAYISSGKETTEEILKSAALGGLLGLLAGTIGYGINCGF